MGRLRDSWPFSLSPAPTVGNPCRPLQPESVSRQPTTKQEAVAKANALSLAGHDLDLGLMGLPAASFAAYGITIEQAFDACTSLRVASTRLKMLTKAAEMRGLPRAKADQDALAAYFGNGDAELGREAGYPAHVMRVRSALDGMSVVLRGWSALTLARMS